MDGVDFPLIKANAIHGEVANRLFSACHIRYIGPNSTQFSSSETVNDKK